MTYYDIGHDLNKNVDVWVSYGEDYKRIPFEFTIAEEREKLHKEEISALLAGRIDHDRNLISMRLNEMSMNTDYISQMARVLKMDFPKYTLWYFPNTGEPMRLR